jgi:hypothetical protein
MVPVLKNILGEINTNDAALQTNLLKKIDDLLGRLSHLDEENQPGEFPKSN